MMRAPNTQITPKAEQIIKRIKFHAAPHLAFVRPDGVLDSCAANSARADALLKDGAAVRAGYVVVGVYGLEATAAQMASDARAAIK